MTPRLELGRSSPQQWGSRSRGCCAGRDHLCGGCARWLEYLWDFYPAIVSHVRSGGLDAASADDIAAEVMTVAWRRLDTVPGAPVEARRWLCGVARNVARNYRRSSFRERRRVARLGEELASGSGRGRVIGEYATSASVDCGLGEPGAVEALDLWQGLDPRDQRVLGLALAGRALDEVAEELACARSAAAMRLSRARRRLALAMSS